MSRKPMLLQGAAAFFKRFDAVPPAALILAARRPGDRFDRPQRGKLCARLSARDGP